MVNQLGRDPRILEVLTNEPRVLFVDFLSDRRRRETALRTGCCDGRGAEERGHDDGGNPVIHRFLFSNDTSRPALGPGHIHEEGTLAPTEANLISF